MEEKKEEKGFDPKEYLIYDENGQGYLPVNGQIKWFRTIYPEGRISQELVQFTGELAVVRTYIYLTREDTIAASDAYAVRKIVPDDPFKKNWVDEAQRGATGVALKQLGFFVGDLEPEDGYAERLDEIGRAGSKDAASDAMSTGDQVASGRNVSQSIIKTPLSKRKEASSSQKLRTTMNKEHALSMIWPFQGSYEGKTIAEMLAINPSRAKDNIDWVAEIYSGPQTELKTACKYLQAYIDRKTA